MNESNMQGDVSDEIAALRRQVFMLLLALVVVSGTLATYLYYQSHVTQKNIEAIQPQATRLAETLNHDLPVIQSFVKQLAAYGNTHPDFAQTVLKKYGITAQSAGATTNAPKK